MEIESWMTMMLLGLDLIGLPDWWCLASAIFAAVIVIVLIYFYFKGRSMMRLKERTIGVRSITCSLCKIHLNEGSLSCPGCGSRFIKDRYFCPHCDKETGKMDKSCANCGTRLRMLRIPGQGTEFDLRDPDLKKLKRSSSKKGLEECTICGALKDPGTKCPICSERR